MNYLFQHSCKHYRQITRRGGKNLFYGFLNKHLYVVELGDKE